MPDKMSDGEDRPAARLRRRGRGRPTAVAPDSPESYYRVADRLTEEIPGAFQPEPVLQPGQPGGALRAAPARSSGSRPAGASRTSSPASGPAARSPASGATSRSSNPTIQVIGADPVGSIYSQGEDAARAVPRRGRRRGLLAARRSTRRSSTATSRSPTRTRSSRRAGSPTTEGILAGGSCGTAVHAALEVGARSSTDPEAMVGVILPDGGRSYLSKVFNDAWMTQHGFLERTGGADGRRRAAPQARRAARSRRSSACARTTACSDAIALLHEHRVSQLPVVSGQRRARASSARSASAGCCGARSTTRRCCRREIVDVMEAPFPAVSVDDEVREADRAAQRRAPGADGHRATGGRSASSRAPTCSRRWPGERARRCPTTRGSPPARCTRGSTPDPHFRSVIPAIHQTSTFAQPAPGEYVEEYDYARTANPTRARARGRARHARGRPRDGVRLRPGRRARADHRGLLGRRPRRPPARPLRRDATGSSTRSSRAGAWSTRWSTRPTSTRSRRPSRRRRASSGSRRRRTRGSTSSTSRASSSAAGDALVVVDNTFATPVNQRPLELGADAVIHSATKYLGGHSDTVSARSSSRDPGLHEQVRFVQNAAGAIPGPMDCFLVHRGLRTLHLRMAASAENARAVSAFLRGAPGVSDVRWPGFSGMVSLPPPRRARHLRAHAHLHARRVARRRRVADRGAAGDDPRLGRGQRRGRPAGPRAAVVRRRGRGRPRRGSGARDRAACSVGPRPTRRGPAMKTLRHPATERMAVRSRISRRPAARSTTIGDEEMSDDIALDPQLRARARRAAVWGPSASTRRRAPRRCASTPSGPGCRSTRSSRSRTRCSCAPTPSPPDRRSGVGRRRGRRARAPARSRAGRRTPRRPAGATRRSRAARRGAS